MTKTHSVTLLEKQGAEWTNDLGHTFPAAPLYCATCACGWRGAAWFSTPERALAVHTRHVAQVTAAA